MAINITGVSVAGRQVLTSLNTEGASDISLILTSATQNQYRYKGFVGLEDASFGPDLFIEGKKIYWRGVQFYFPTGLAYTQKIVAYWAIAGLSWNLRVNP